MGLWMLQAGKMLNLACPERKQGGGSYSMASTPALKACFSQATEVLPGFILVLDVASMSLPIKVLCSWTFAGRSVRVRHGPHEPVEI